MHRHAAQERLDCRALFARGAQGVKRCAGLDAVDELTAFRCVQNQPCLGLAELAVLHACGVIVIRVYLHGQRFGGINQLQQQREGLLGVLARKCFAVSGNQVGQLYARVVGGFQPRNARHFQTFACRHFADVLAVHRAQLLAAPRGQLTAAERRVHFQRQQRAVVRQAHFQCGEPQVGQGSIADMPRDAHPDFLVEGEGGTVVHQRVAAQRGAALRTQNGEHFTHHAAPQPLPLLFRRDAQAVERAGLAAEEPVDGVVSGFKGRIEGDGGDNGVPFAHDVERPGVDTLVNLVSVGVRSPVPLGNALFVHGTGDARVQGADGIEIGRKTTGKQHNSAPP